MFLGLSRTFWLMRAAVAVVTAGAIALPRVYLVALLGSGYMSQTLCAGLFVSGRDMDDITAHEMNSSVLLQLFQPAIDRETETVTASAFGIARQTAIHRHGRGCTLLDGADEETGALRPQRLFICAVEEGAAEPMAMDRGLAGDAKGRSRDRLGLPVDRWLEQLQEHGAVHFMRRDVVHVAARDEQPGAERLGHVARAEQRHEVDPG